MREIYMPSRILVQSVFVLCTVLVVTGCSPSSSPEAEEMSGGGIALASGDDGLQPGSVTPSVEVDAIAVDSADQVLYRKLMATALDRGLASMPLGQIIQAVGNEFLGADYVAGMLDAPDREMLVLSLTKFDCVLFVETALAAAQGVALGDSTFEGFAGRVQNLRYRGGVLDGYCSRLHYFSDWIADNESRGTVVNVTPELDGAVEKQSPDFMSSNRKLYKRFAKDDSLFAGIREMEQNLRSVPIYYVPQDRIADAYAHMRGGDIIATSTDVEGLDVSHTGFAFDNKDGTFGFMHASTSGGVKVSPDLAKYVAGNKKQTGILVVRPVNGRNN